MSRKETVGQLALKARADTTKYDALEVAHALTEDIAKELMICAQRHRAIFDEDEYCVGYVLASDPLIQGVMRRKFFAFLYLPSPRPDQAIFLYNKRLDVFTKRLWTLPNALVMAELSEMTSVDKRFKDMKGWCDAFFAFKFWEHIRSQHNITMLSEIEYLKANREKLIQAGCKEIKPTNADAFDFSKVSAYKVIDSEEAAAHQ